MVAGIQEMNTAVRETFNATLLTSQQLDKLQINKLQMEKLSPSIRFIDEKVPLKQLGEGVDKQHESLRGVLDNTVNQILAFMVGKGWHEQSGMLQLLRTCY
jgi:AAA+ superfamily predicted ATPase